MKRFYRVNEKLELVLNIRNVSFRNNNSNDSLSDIITYSEEELISLLKGKEEYAFSYLYDHYSAALFGVILHIIPQNESAEDVLQEVFLKIYHNIESYNSAKGRLYTWMIQIARNTAIDTTRSKDYKKSLKIRELNNTVSDLNMHPSLNTSHDAIGLKKIMNELNDEQKKIIDLAYFKGFTQEEISSELNLPLGTVKSRARSAMKQLRRLLHIT